MLAIRTASGKVDDDVLLLAGEISILKEIGGTLLEGDLIMGMALMECLMNNRIVSGMTLSRWALANHSSANGDDEGGVPTHIDWWKYASLAIRHTLRQSCSQFEAKKKQILEVESE